MADILDVVLGVAARLALRRGIDGDDATALPGQDGTVGAGGAASSIGGAGAATAVLLGAVAQATCAHSGGWNA